MGFGVVLTYLDNPFTKIQGTYLHVLASLSLVNCNFLETF